MTQFYHYIKEWTYYEPQNTGWSGGVSWFVTGDDKYNPPRYKTKKEAIEHNKRARESWNDPSVKWRIVKKHIIETHYYEKDNKDHNSVR